MHRCSVEMRRVEGNFIGSWQIRSRLSPTAMRSERAQLEDWEACQNNAAIRTIKGGDEGRWGSGASTNVGFGSSVSLILWSC